MEFSSDETAYIAYSKYASNHGFNVRKQRTAKKEMKMVRWQGFFMYGQKRGLGRNLRSRDLTPDQSQGVVVKLIWIATFRLVEDIRLCLSSRIITMI